MSHLTARDLKTELMKLYGASIKIGMFRISAF